MEKEKEEEGKEEHRYINTRGLGMKGAGSKEGSQTSRVPLLMPSTIGPRHGFVVIVRSRESWG